MIYKFGLCALDTDRRILRTAGETVHIEPQVFELLLTLLEARGSVVGKDALVDRVWRGLHVSDATIASRINAARKAVGDDGKSQRIIKTIPKVGFQLMVEAEAPSPVTVPVASTVKYTQSADAEPIAYSSNGSGPALVRVSHWLSHLNLDLHSPIWLPFLQRLGQHFTLHRYDQRATGLSTRSVTNLTLDTFVEDLKAVFDANDLNQAPIFAASQAVPVAIRFAHRHPDRVSRMVLYGGYAVGRFHREKEIGDVEEDTVLSLIRAGWGNENSPFFKAFTTLFMPGATSEQIESFVEMQSRSISPEGAVILRQVVDRFMVLDDLEHVSHPVLVIHARDDGVHPVSQGQLLASRLPNAEFIMLDSANHVALPQDPAWTKLTDAVISFCSE